MVLRLDELNTLRSQPFDEYFGVMNLTEDQIKRRIAFADAFELFMLSVMYTISNMRDYDLMNWDYIDGMVEEGYRDILRDFITEDDYTDRMVQDFSKNFRESTEKALASNIEKAIAAWMLSADRARFNAENEANNVLNYGEYTDAVDDGYTTKTWHTELDERVRPTHEPLEGVTIPIADLFQVGNAYMRFAKDELAADFPEEIVNCRCTVSYGR